MQPDPTAIATGARLREVLEEIGVSGAELARRLDMPQSNIARRILGRTPITVPELARIASVLDVPVDYLLPTAAQAA